VGIVVHRGMGGPPGPPITKSSLSPVRLTKISAAADRGMHHNCRVDEMASRSDVT
jgi:hypothetical protein